MIYVIEIGFWFRRCGSNVVFLMFIRGCFTATWVFFQRLCYLENSYVLDVFDLGLESPEMTIRDVEIFLKCDD